MSVRILLADDEIDLRETVRYALVREGFTVDEAADGERALEAARATSYDLVLLDVMMPKLSGLDVCRTMRAESDVPIIMLTAKDSELDTVLGLELGADDYVPKPFSIAELISRIRSLLRRREIDLTRRGGDALVIGGLRLDLFRHSVEVDGTDVALTASEFKVLQMLAEEPQRVFSRQQIMEHLWESLYVGDARACDVHISNLRQKIERDPVHPERIVTVRSIGYKLVPA